MTEWSASLWLEAESQPLTGLLQILWERRGGEKPCCFQTEMWESDDAAWRREEDEWDLLCNQTSFCKVSD